MNILPRKKIGRSQKSVLERRGRTYRYIEEKETDKQCADRGPDQTWEKSNLKTVCTVGNS